MLLFVGFKYQLNEFGAMRKVRIFDILPPIEDKVTELLVINSIDGLYIALG
jgi:hypothetical protein